MRNKKSATTAGLEVGILSHISQISRWFMITTSAINHPIDGKFMVVSGMTCRRLGKSAKYRGEIGPVSPLSQSPFRRLVGRFIPNFSTQYPKLKILDLPRGFLGAVTPIRYTECTYESQVRAKYRKRQATQVRGKQQSPCHAKLRRTSVG